MTSDLVLWGALGLLIALMVLAVWAGRRGLHALGVVGPAKGAPDRQLGELVVELRRLNANLEALVERETRGPDHG
jgi:hypothetical protein